MSHEKLGAGAFPSPAPRVVACLLGALLSSVVAVPRGHSILAAGTDVRLSTIPRRVFVDNDGIVEAWPTESFLLLCRGRRRGQHARRAARGADRASVPSPFRPPSFLRGPCRVC